MSRNLDLLREYHGLFAEHWEQLGDRGRELYELVRPTPGKFYQVDVQATRLESWVSENRRDLASAGGGLELEPDFQRGHVWSEAQQTAFCESFIRGQASALLLFNCPSYHDIVAKRAGNLPPSLMQCVDGLQRYTALTQYAAGAVKVFGGLTSADFKHTAFDATRQRVQVRVYGLLTRSDLLDFYLQLNAGGTVHAESELARVRALATPRPRRPSHRHHVNARHHRKRPHTAASSLDSGELYAASRIASMLPATRVAPMRFAGTGSANTGAAAACTYAGFWNGRGRRAVRTAWATKGARRRKLGTKVPQATPCECSLRLND